MKLTKEEFERSQEQSPIELFYQGLRAKETKEKYTRTLKQILCKMLEDILDGDFEQRTAQLVQYAKNDPDWVKDLFLNLSRKFRQRTQLPKDHQDYLNPQSVDNYFKPLKKLFDMNDITFSWTRIYSTFPELDNISDSRGWTRKEIQTMLRFANGPIDRAVILVVASSGIRVGGFDFDWQDLTPIYNVDNELRFEITESEIEKAQIACAMLTVYRGSSEAYPAFITPEAYHALLDYKIEWVSEVGRQPKLNDPIFKQEGPFLKRATSVSIKKRLERILKNSGLRKPLPKNKRRYEVPMMNGFRRFWNKTCKESVSRDSPLASLIKKEFMMGHSGLIKLDRNYFKTHTLELAEEYLNAVPNLTISDEEREKAENNRLRKENAEYRTGVDKLEQKFATEQEQIHYVMDVIKGLEKKFEESLKDGKESTPIDHELDRVGED